MLALFNIFNLVSYVLYVVVIFRLYVVQIYGSGLGRHDPSKAQRALGSGYATFSTIWAGNARSKSFFWAFLARACLAQSMMGPDRSGPISGTSHTCIVKNQCKPFNVKCFYIHMYSENLCKPFNMKCFYIREG
jgi:hypothetical protein